MENRFKLTISKLLQTCQSKNISDVTGDPFFFPENCHHHRQLIDLFSPKPQFISKPKSHPEISNKTPSVRKKSHYRKPKKMDYISSETASYYYDWRSSDEEDDTDDATTLFSSRSFRSESSGSFRKNRANRKSGKKSKRGSGGVGAEGNGSGVRNYGKDSDGTPLEKSGKVLEDSFAVAKRSMNPYEDFRVSMVEMIVEKQIFGTEELKNLFECFISLNSDEHHGVIFEVFSEILETLFSPKSVRSWVEREKLKC